MSEVVKLLKDELFAMEKRADMLRRAIAVLDPAAVTPKASVRAPDAKPAKAGKRIVSEATKAKMRAAHAATKAKKKAIQEAYPPAADAE